MSAKSYPGRRRATKAYWLGVDSANRGRAVNPYTNAKLRDLFDRGRQDGLSGRWPQPGPSAPRPPLPVRPPPRPPRPGGGGRR